MSGKRSPNAIIFSRHLALTAVFTLYAGAAYATGWWPFVSDDSATVKRGGTVSVLDSGETSVLANDFDIEGDRMTAVLVKAPRRGQLELFEDGTFIYRHDGSRDDDEDEFEYRAFDGTRFSRSAEVEIEIVPGDPVAPEITGQRDISVAEDDPNGVEIELRDLVVFDPDNSYPRDFTLEVGDGENYTRAGATITPSPDFNGLLTVPVRVFDGNAFSNPFLLRVTVTPTNDPPTVIGDVADQEATEGKEFSVAVADRFDDIDAGDTLRFSASGLPASGSLSIDPQSGILGGTPIRADAVETPYSVRVTATDSAGASASLTFNLLILPDNRSDLAVSARVAQNPTLVGDPTTWTIEVENLGPADLEEGELTASWTTAGAPIDLTVPSGCTLSSNNSSQPSIACPLVGLAVGETFAANVEGMQEDDGDNTVFVRALADDPVDENNAARVSAQVAAAFTEGPAQTISASGRGIAAADFDGDGNVDLAVIDEALTVFPNTGNRTFDATGTVIGEGGTHVLTFDWNGDGAADLAGASRESAEVSIYVGDGLGVLAAAVTFRVPGGGVVSAASALDTDADGIDELVLTGTSGTVLVRNSGNGDPVFEPVSNVAGLGTAATDFDMDGFNDVAVIAADDRTVRLFRNDGAGSFLGAGSFDAGPVASLKAVDFDRDGAADLLLAINGTESSAPYTQIMRGQGDGTFAFHERLGASRANELLAGDVDADGYIDVVVVNDAGVHQLYLGTATGGFTLDAEQIVSDGMGCGLLLDFNDDESLDLILAGQPAEKVEMHANNGLGRLGRGDVEPPELTLQGEAVISVPAGNEFVDPGAIAVDDIDGDLTDQISVSGTVNVSVVGKYTLTYSVADRASNMASVTRTVQVGVNAGTGGGGGGSLSAVMLFVLLLFLGCRYHMQCVVAKTRSSAGSRGRAETTRQPGLLSIDPDAIL